MEFFQVVHPRTLVPKSALLVLAEIAAVVVLAILVGAAMSIVPARLVPQARSKARKPKPRPVAPAAKNATRGDVVAPSAATAPAAPTTAATATSAEEGKFLDNVLDSFFAEQSVLDEALVDTAIATAHAEKPAPAPSAPPPKTTPSKAPASSIDSDLASKMMRGLGDKKKPASTAASNKPSATPTMATTKPPAPPPTEEDLLNQALGDLTSSPPPPKKHSAPQKTPDADDNLLDLAMQEATKPTSRPGALEEIDEL